MRGGAQSHLMRCADGQFYVVKFLNNPQHPRVLANELLATRLAERIALAVPHTDVISVSSWLINSTDDLRFGMGRDAQPCQAGACFGSRYVADPGQGVWQALDYLPEEHLHRVHNLNEFAGILCLDKWTGNTNGRQAVFYRKPRQHNYRAMFIDQGYCFNAGEWRFPDAPLRGVYMRNAVYAHVTGWASFEPWITRLENITEAEIGEIAS